MKHVIPAILAGLLLLIGGLLLGGNSFAADVSASGIIRDGTATATGFNLAPETFTTHPNRMALNFMMCHQ